MPKILVAWSMSATRGDRGEQDRHGALQSGDGREGSFARIEPEPAQHGICDQGAHDEYEDGSEDQAVHEDRGDADRGEGHAEQHEHCDLGE